MSSDDELWGSEESLPDIILPTDYDPDPDYHFHTIQDAIDKFRTVYSMDALRYLDLNAIIETITNYFTSARGAPETTGFEGGLTDYDLGHYIQFIRCVLDDDAIDIYTSDIYAVHHLLIARMDGLRPPPKTIPIVTGHIPEPEIVDEDEPPELK